MVLIVGRTTSLESFHVVVPHGGKTKESLQRYNVEERVCLTVYCSLSFWCGFRKSKDCLAEAWHVEMAYSKLVVVMPRAPRAIRPKEL